MGHFGVFYLEINLLQFSPNQISVGGTIAVMQDASTNLGQNFG
jgi:hypothetical protein